MLVIDASALAELVTDGVSVEAVRASVDGEQVLTAPHLIDAEVLAVIQSHRRTGELDDTAAMNAVDALRAWPGRRRPNRPLLARAWELRHNVGLVAKRAPAWRRADFASQVVGRVGPDAVPARAEVSAPRVHQRFRGATLLLGCCTTTA